MAFVLTAVSAAGAASGALQLNAVLYPEGKKVPVVFETTDRAAVREDRSGKGSFATPQKVFALMVTAEPLTVVRKPSNVVAFVSSPTTDKMAKNSNFAYSDFRTQYTARERDDVHSAPILGGP